MEETDYNYGRFRARYYTLTDFPGPTVGEKAADFVATALDGQQVRLSDFLGKKVVLETGSITCPGYVPRIRSMNEVAQEHPNVVFLVLYVREAHPGSRIPQHTSSDEKLALANRLPAEEDENRMILVDDLDGTAHQLYGSLPNVVYIIDEEGRVAFRMDWNDPEVVDKVLSGEKYDHLVTNDHREPAKSPVAALRVLRRAGWGAIWDLALSLPKLLMEHRKASEQALKRKHSD